MKNRYLIALLGAVAMLSVGQAAAQSNSSQARPCLADPDSSGTDTTLSEQLDECNGVLVPPKVGDSEFVEPAPDAGEIIIIPPGELPDQQSGADVGGADRPVTQDGTTSSN